MSRLRRMVIAVFEWSGWCLCVLGGDDPRESRLTHWGWVLAGYADLLKPGRRWGP